MTEAASSNNRYTPYCIATVVTEKAITAMLEVSGTGSYRDNHPWLIAADYLNSTDATVPILFAALSEQGGAKFSHWSEIISIDVVELHRATWDTRCQFSTLHEINPIWTDIDSVFLKASQEQMDRELREGIRVSRAALDEHHIHPYALCETPAFILEQGVVTTE